MNNKYVLISLLFAILLIFSSCRKIVVRILTEETIEKQITKLENDSTGQTVIMLPMTHIGTPAYYQSVRSTIDNHRKDNFIVYYEGIGIEKDKIDSLSTDTLLRKLRKLLGQHIVGGYTNKENKSIPKALKGKRYISQNNEILGVDSIWGDQRVDLNLDYLIEMYESKKSPIILEDCDFEVDLNEKYKKCKGKKKYDSHYVIQNLRNDHVVKVISENPLQNIILLYGKRHANWIASGLRKKGFKLKEKGKVIYMSIDE